MFYSSKKLTAINYQQSRKKEISIWKFKFARTTITSKPPPTLNSISSITLFYFACWMLHRYSVTVWNKLNLILSNLKSHFLSPWWQSAPFICSGACPWWAEHGCYRWQWCRAGAAWSGDTPTNTAHNRHHLLAHATTQVLFCIVASTKGVKLLMFFSVWMLCRW